MIKKVYFVLFVLLNFFSRSADNVHIPIVYACDDNYVMPTIVSMESAVRSMKDTSFYEFTILIPGEFKSENTRRFDTFKNSYKNKCSVEIKNMKNAYSGSYVSHWWTITMYYRLDIPFLLSDKDKAIYLDGDTLVRHDLQEMWNIDLGDNLCGGVRDPNQYERFDELKCPYSDIYINSGVLLINCKAWREELSLKDDIKKYCQNVEANNFKYPDQDILNVVCAGRIRGIPLKFMRFILDSEDLEYEHNEYAKLFCTKEEFLEGKDDPVIVHYLGREKPWLIYKETSDELYCDWCKLFDAIKGKYEFKELEIKSEPSSRCCCCLRG